MTFIRLERQKGWITSMGFVYSSNVTESFQERIIEPLFMVGRIFNDNWIFNIYIPFGYVFTNYDYVEGQQEKKSEEMYYINNITVIPAYRFKWKSKWIEFPVAIQLPTFNKVEDDITFKKREKIFAIEPSINIVKTNDPIVSCISFSFNQPLWKQEKKNDIYELWNIKANSEFYFVVNENFSFLSKLGVSVGKKEEILLLEYGVIYYVTPYTEWRISLFNCYTAGEVRGSIGLFFTKFY